MSRADAWMPLYVGDYLADTGHLRTVEHGAYLLLILHYWRTGPLPDDAAALARVARLDRREAADVIATLRPMFNVVDGAWTHKRIDAERDRAAQISGKRASAGRAGAAVRHGKCQANAMQMPDNCQPFANDLPEQTHRQSQSQSQGSVAAATGGKPPHDLFGAKPRSAREALFADGLAILMRITGKPQGQCRSALGGLLKGLDDDCARLMALLREAETAPPADPMAWLTAACSRKGGKGARGWTARALAERAGITINMEA